MFKEQYTQDNENIRLSDETKAYMLYKLNQKANAKAAPAKAAAPHYGLRRVAAAALSLAVAVGCGALVARHRPTVPQIEQVQNVADYQELYALNKKILKDRENSGYTLYSGLVEVQTGGDAEDGAIVDEALDVNVGTTTKPTTSQGESENLQNEYSGTNTQHADVDEADIVKTDGKYLYVLAQNADRVSILQAAGADTRVLATITMPQKEKTDEGVVQTDIESMYVVGDRLVLIINRIHRNTGYYGAVIYDITNRTAPKMLKTLLQSGAAETTRVVDGVLYIISRYYVNENIQQDTPEGYIPNFLADETAALCPVEDIAVVPQPKATQYTVVGSVDIATATRIDQHSVFGSAAGVYANTQNIYTAATRIEDGKSVTDLVRFAISKGQIAMAATGKVPGHPLNQFSMDEYEGAFRIVTTVQDYKASANGGYYFSTGQTENALYVLDQNLQITGQIENIAPDERVYSVRFMGNVGYFVTFRETDPLFSVDLSDPTAPKILGALKIPGFSSYLHPYSDGKLLGLGMQADENGVTTGVKLSMFDISDPTNVTESHTLVLDARYSDALYDHKAVLVSQPKNLIGFTTEQDYALYGYDPEQGFTLRATLTQCYGARGLYIGDVFYLCTREKVEMYTLDTFAPLGRVDLT